MHIGENQIPTLNKLIAKGDGVCLGIALYKAGISFLLNVLLARGL